jgi:hypothetical protein
MTAHPTLTADEAARVVGINLARPHSTRTKVVPAAESYSVAMCSCGWSGSGSATVADQARAQHGADVRLARRFARLVTAERNAT